MKTLILSLSVMIIFTKCSHTRFITEQFIKTEIETHKTNEFSSIRLYSVYKKKLKDVSFIELCGYKYNGNKGLVIAADKIKALKKEFKEDNAKLRKTKFIVLSVDQCQTILNNYHKLYEQIKNEKQHMSEDIFSDYTVSDELVISFKRRKRNQKMIEMDLWIGKEKYTVVTKEVISKIERFINY